MTRVARGRGEDGFATVFAAAAIAALLAVTVIVVDIGAAVTARHRAQAAADLAALAGARAQGDGADACAAVGESADRNEVEVIGCRVAGDEVEFVVSVEVRAPFTMGPATDWFVARAHAGMVTGAPE